MQNVRGADNELTAADLFCGAGGLSQGLTDAGFSVLAAADHDPDACATYRQNFPGTVLTEGDLTARAKHAELVETVGAGRLDLLAGGPPCQAFSQIHNHDRLLTDPRNRLYREFVQFLGELRPRALLVENVPGLNQLAGERFAGRSSVIYPSTASTTWSLGCLTPGTSGPHSDGNVWCL